MGARSAGIGYSVATLADGWSLMNNVGGLGRVKSVSLVTGYETKPALPGSDRFAAAFATPFKFGTFGVGAFRFGDDIYNEQMVTVGFGNQFGLASLGLKINYIQFKAEGFGTKSVVAVNFGGVADITPQILVGAYITNINQPQLADDENLPTKLSTGIQFKADPNLILVAEIEKDLKYSPTIKGGFEYTIHKKVLARSGFNINPNAAFAGIGYKLYRFQIDYGIAWNTNTRLAHQMSVNFNLSKKNDTR